MQDESDLQLDQETTLLLQMWVRTASSQKRLVRRSRIVLLLASGLTHEAVAEHVGVSRRTVSLWKQRFIEGGPSALPRDRPGRGRPKGRSAIAVASIASAMTVPPEGHDRWTARRLAKHVGVSHSTVLRVWREAKS